jgi:hypothetical protein
MNWTKTPPTKPGAYWFRRGKGCTLVNFCFICGNTGEKGFSVCGFEGPHTEIGFDGGEWCGPLVPAEEVCRAYYEGHINAISSDPDMDPQEHSWPNSRARKIVEGEL